MVARLDPCDPDSLRLLLADRLPPARVGELEDHLQRCPHCRRALDEMVGGEAWWSAVRANLGGAAPPQDAELPDEDDPLDFLSPSDDPSSLGRVGPYEVQGLLGRGGNGVVLKALDPGLNRFVAVKVIATVLAGSGAARKRFQREAQAAAAVVHEHVVAVHAVDEAGGLPYLVMEYVPGRSLQERIDRQGPLELKEILRIGLQTASGLAAAHAQGLVHRDIKPANILLENGIERVKITDFGLARAVADASLTQSGVITGTPHYMAPEQARGVAIDHRADLFSLGCTLYAMAVGHPPFRAETPLAVLRRITDEAPRPVRELNPDIPGWLEAILDRLLAKNPDDRFQTAAEVAELLERCLAHVQQPLAVPLPAVPGLPSTRNGRLLQARLGLATGLAALVVGLILVLVSGPGDTTSLPREPTTPEPAAGWVQVPQGATPWILRPATEPIPLDPAEAGIKFDAQFRGYWMQTQEAAAQGRRLDVIDLVLDALQEQLRLVERQLKLPLASVLPSADPIDEEIERLGARAKALEDDLAPIRTRK